jgi:sugar/nucleoside kinase (ribokinase family)
MVPDYLAIGHISKDLRPDGSGVAGGTVLYATLTAQRLGRQAAMVTALAAADADLLAGARAAGIAYEARPAPATTTFDNQYHGEARRQVLHAQATRLAPEDVPPAWRAAPIVHLGPVAQEIDSDPVWPALFPGALIGVTPQGWMRAWGADGFIHPIPWAGAAALLTACHVLVMSEEDAGGDAALLAAYARHAPLAIITAGSHPATIYEHGRPLARVPAFHADPVDFTGAGDVFAAAFLVAYHETGDPVRAATLAHAAAACAIEADGTTGIPARAVVEQRLRGARET